MKYILLISLTAKQDISEAFEWYKSKNIEIAEKFEQQTLKAIEEIEDNPFKVQIRYLQVRVAFLDRFPYGIHFIVKDDIITVVAVFHTAQNPERWINK